MDINVDLKTRCHVNTNEEGDRFVGIKADTTDAVVYFPVGYQLPEDRRMLRQDILHLFQVLSEFTESNNRVLQMKKFEAPQSVDFPITAYLEVINYYMTNGYYMEKESVYQTADRGNIDWAKTFQRNTAMIQSNLTPVYTQYTVRKSTPNSNKEITRIHKYCVYESFNKLGWLFTPDMPDSPDGDIDITRSVAILRDKLGSTNNDTLKALFKAMIEVLKYIDENPSEKQFFFGTDYFEHVWEKLIDKVFGIKSKEDYFPRSRWLLTGRSNRAGVKEKYPLEPDTIMLYDGKVYVLDAKYYRFGITGNPNHLPDASSINKQITYGEYIAQQKKAPENCIFNAFLMPYNANPSDDDRVFDFDQNFENIGMAVGDWKDQSAPYERIMGILVDTRFLMTHYTGSPKSHIASLAQSIEQAFTENDGLLPKSGSSD